MILTSFALIIWHKIKQKSKFEKNKPDYANLKLSSIMIFLFPSILVSFSPKINPKLTPFDPIWPNLTSFDFNWSHLTLFDLLWPPLTSFNLIAAFLTSFQIRYQIMKLLARWSLQIKRLQKRLVRRQWLIIMSHWLSRFLVHFLVQSCKLDFHHILFQVR